METGTILREHGLRQTDSRNEILKVFLNRNFALSHSFLEEHLQASYDRVTIYRTLHTFLDKGIIHKVPDEGSSNKYALCQSHSCSAHQHHDNHIHFKCETCGVTNCFEEVAIPNLSLPEGFLAKETGILIVGLCKNCNQK